MTIDLIHLGKSKQPAFNWPYGRVHTVPLVSAHVVVRANELIKNTNADWFLFWDEALGIPNTQLLNDLCNTNIDVWHAGLKLGVTRQPFALDYVDPAWLYNKNAPDNITSSSFRLSLRACLIRADVLKQVHGIPASYWTLDMAGIALGYTIIKSGGMMRHHPDIVSSTEKPHAMPLRDEWAFIRQFFSTKWQLWILLQVPNFRVNYKYWRKTADVPRKTLNPCLHSSETLHNAAPATVSVLAPTLDRYPYLQKELEQLAKQTVLPHEVLITDQTDEVRKQAIDSSLYPELTIRYFPQSEKGQCIAWNKLLSEASGAYVLFLGDDADNIKPDFISKLLSTAHFYGADMVASNVIELKAPKREINHHYYMADTFPIALIRRQLALDAGMMDMFFNKNIRADYDLALRCHEMGAFMIFDSSALIDHHRAPSGGLRAHNARKITNAISKSSVSKFAEPTASELFLVKKHFNALQYKMFVRIKYFDQLMIQGNIAKKMLRVIVFLSRWPGMKKRYKQRVAEADAELRKHGILQH